MYTDAMAAATRRQTEPKLPTCSRTKIKARCEHGNIINIHDLFWAKVRVQLHLPPLRSLDLLISPGTLFWTLPAQHTTFNTLDNWGHKPPTYSKRKRTGKKRLKGAGVYNTLGYILIQIKFSSSSSLALSKYFQ